MADVDVYRVKVNGMTLHLQLTEDDAKNYPDAQKVTTEERRGVAKAARPASNKKASPPANKSGD